MTTKEMIAVMQAYEDGKAIEFRDRHSGEWGECSIPLWDWHAFDYRIKPEPKYVPYDSVAEVEKDKWVVNKTDGIKYQILAIDSLNNSVLLPTRGFKKLDALFRDYTYEDGAPCGKKAE